MASRRVRSEFSSDDKVDTVQQTSEPSDIRPAVPASVIAKLLGFTFAMITLPIGIYFLTVKTIFKGNSTYAGALAAVTANVVLIGYVIVAMAEDQSEQREKDEKSKKAE